MAKREFDGVNIKIEFNETANRQQISSGDNVNTLFGKIRKWFSDLKLVALSGSYNDLSDKPTIPTKISELEDDIPLAHLDSPSFTGSPTAPNPDLSENSTRLATTSYVKTLIAGLIDGAPASLDTLREIADAIVENEDAMAILNTAIANKVNKTGDTMSGHLTIQDRVNGGFKCAKTGGPSLWLGIGSGGVNNGIYSDTLAKWMIYSNGSNVYLNGNAETATNADKVDNCHASYEATGNTVVQRNANGYIKATYFNQSSSYEDGAGVGGFFFQNSSNDGYLRKMTLARAKSVLGIDDLKKSVSDGKKLVANAITAKGVSTAADATFATMANNISNILAGVSGGVIKDFSYLGTSKNITNNSTRNDIYSNVIFISPNSFINSQPTLINQTPFYDKNFAFTSVGSGHQMRVAVFGLTKYSDIKTSLKYPNNQIHFWFGINKK